MGFAAGLLRQDLLIIINTERAKRASNKTTVFDWFKDLLDQKAGKVGFIVKFTVRYSFVSQYLFAA